MLPTRSQPSQSVVCSSVYHTQKPSKIFEATQASDATFNILSFFTLFFALREREDPHEINYPGPSTWGCTAQDSNLEPPPKERAGVREAVRLTNFGERCHSMDSDCKMFTHNATPMYHVCTHDRRICTTFYNLHLHEVVLDTSGQVNCCSCNCLENKPAHLCLSSFVAHKIPESMHHTHATQNQWLLKI